MKTKKMRMIRPLLSIIISLLGIFFIGGKILDKYNLGFRPWVELTFAFVVLISCIIIFILVATIFWEWCGNYEFKRIKKTYAKYLSTLIIAVSTVLSAMAIIMVLFFLGFIYNPEHVVINNGEKMVAVVNSFLKVNVYYHSYENMFIMGKPIITEEYYGKGGYDPFTREDIEVGPEIIRHYDKKGNMTEAINLNMPIKVSEDIKSEIPNETINSLDGLNVKFKSFPTDLIGYAFIVSDTAMHNEQITLYKTEDGGDAWNIVGILPHCWIIYYAELLTEEIGFVSYGPIGNTIQLYSTEDGGKTWEEVQIESYSIESSIGADEEKIISFPYLFVDSIDIEDEIWYMQVGLPNWAVSYKKGYVLYSSEDRGKTWSFYKEIKVE